MKRRAARGGEDSRAPDFAARLLAWFDAHGRHDLPWQHPRTAYRVWIAEVMLQQTQVVTVIPYYRRFMSALPDLPALAAAELDTVLALWSGLGYYSRARNLHRAAKICMEQHKGELPAEFAALSALPGIGRSTAGAILAQGHDLRFPILDGNVRRVLCRFHGVRGWPGSTPVQRRLWELAEAHLPHERLADYTQAVMDLGATVCTRRAPACLGCPLREDCVARCEDTTAELPTAKPGKALPQRELALLLAIASDGRVLLERRPPVGVWAELWSLPEFAGCAAAVEWASLHLRADNGAFAALPPLAHGFSHYRLLATPLALRGVQPGFAVNEEGCYGWYAPPELAGLGLPAPIRRLLREQLPVDS